jgi:hypothetical protein
MYGSTYPVGSLKTCPSEASTLEMCFIFPIRAMKWCCILNCLHQDLYSEHVFPFQVTILLSEPGRDFARGTRLGSFFTTPHENGCMTLNLCGQAKQGQTQREALCPGAGELRRCVVPDATAIFAVLHGITTQAPFRHMLTPGGFRMSVVMTRGRQPLNHD